MVEIEKYSFNGNNDPEVERTAEGNISDISDIELGSEHLEGKGKAFVQVTITNESGERTAGRFVAKKFGTKQEALDELELCTILHKNGVSVPKTHRYFEKDSMSVILYTDLSNNGENQVWSLNNFAEAREHIKVDPNEFEEIHEQLSYIATMASALSIRISADSYFIIRKPNGKLEVVVGDLGLGVHRVAQTDTQNYIKNEQSIEALCKLVQLQTDNNTSTQEIYSQMGEDFNALIER